MPDAIQPVGAMIQPQNPQQGLNTMSSILGIQQQRLGLQQQSQALQTGQYQQQTAQAESSQAQQKNNELQGLARYTKAAGEDPSYMLADGSPDIGKFQKGANAVAPVYGAPVIGQLTSNFKEAVETRRTVQTLSNEQNSSLANGLKGIAGMKDATPTDLENMTTQLRSNNPDPGYNRMLDHFLLGVDKNDIPGSAAKAAAYLAGISPTSGTNAAGQTQVVNPLTQARSMPALSGGATNPASPKVAGATAGEVSRAGGSGNADIDRSNQVSAAVAPANKTVLITNEIDGLADQIHSGKLSASISKAAAAVGLSSTTYARQLLEKDLGQLRINATPASATDQRQATVISGLPEATSDPQTIHTSMDYTRGVARQDLARGAQLNAIKSKDPSLRGFQAADDTLTGTTDPLMHEFKSLNTPADRTAFYKRNFSNAKDPAAAAEAFRNKVAGMGHVFGQ